MKNFLSYLLAIAWSLSLIGCGDLKISDQIKEFPMLDLSSLNFNHSQSGLSETAPPTLITKLGKIVDNYSPKISIIEPSADEILEDTKVTVKLKVIDLPLFKDESLEIGPHLNLILDNEPYQEIYSVEEPIVLKNLAPGTHTLRVFAVRPWDESFKNQGAYAETRFHVFTKTQANSPDAQLPLLTYSSPQGIYGAEPIMLDFYLSHLPFEQLVTNSATEGLPPWRVKVTINGESFLLEQWQPVYLTGFEIGKNLIELELFDDQGNRINNSFNSTVRLITYNPEIKDSLSKIVKGEIDLKNAIAIVDPNYEIPLKETLQAVEEEVPPTPATENTHISESIPEQLIKQESTKANEIPIDNSAAIEQKVNLKSETIVENSATTPEQTTDKAFTASSSVSADDSEFIEEEVIQEELTLEEEISPEISESKTYPQPQKSSSEEDNIAEIIVQSEPQPIEDQASPQESEPVISWSKIKNWLKSSLNYIQSQLSQILG